MVKHVLDIYNTSCAYCERYAVKTSLQICVSTSQTPHHNCAGTWFMENIQDFQTISYSCINGTDVTHENFPKTCGALCNCPYSMAHEGHNSTILVTKLAAKGIWVCLCMCFGKPKLLCASRYLNNKNGYHFATHCVCSSWVIASHGSGTTLIGIIRTYEAVSFAHG